MPDPNGVSNKDAAEKDHKSGVARLQFSGADTYPDGKGLTARKETAAF